MLFPWVMFAAGLALPVAEKAEDQQRPRAGPPPLVCLATAVEKDGNVQMRLSASILHPYKVTKPVARTVVVPAKGGKGTREETRWERKTETAYSCLPKKTVFAVDGAEVKVSRKNGQKVDPRDLPKLLRKETPVLLFTVREMDPAYLRLAGDDVLIVVAPVHKVFPAQPEPNE